MTPLDTNSPLVPTARQDGPTVFASLAGEIDLHNSPDLRTVLLDTLLKGNPTRVVLTLADVPYMDSSGIAVIVEALQRVRRNSGKIVLVNPSPRVRGALEIARLETILPIVMTEEEAGRV